MELPQEVVTRILSRLHPLQAVRAKLVCKTWRRAASNLSSPPASCAPGFVIESLSSSHRLLYADLSCLSWRHLPLLEQPASLHAIADSFLCLSTSLPSKPQRTQLHVLNPLSRSHVCIPHNAPLQPAPFLVGLCLGSHSHSFKVVVAGHKAVAERNKPFNVDLELPVKVYDSVANSWHPAGSVEGAATEYANPVCVGHQIYWLCGRSIRRHVLAFNAEDETWRLMGASSLQWWPQDLIPYTLWAWEGQIYLAGERENALTVWKLARDESEWAMHLQIDPHVVQTDHFCGCKDVAGQGPLLCMMLVWVRKGIVYDLGTHTKSWLPYCPLSSSSWGNVLPYMLGFARLS